MYDVHTHFIPPDVLAWLKENQQTVNAKWEKKAPDKEEFLTVNGKWAFELKQLFTDASLYLKEQGKAGITHSLVSPIPQLFLYDFPADITIEISRVYNDGLTKWTKETPERLSALGTVPLNSTEDAALQLNEAMALGLKGVIIGPGYQEHMLTDDYFVPFWEEANRLKAIVFIHPLLCEDPRLKRRMMPQLIGVPWESTVCAADILLSGLLDRFPDVKILLAHGGGLLPYQIGRLNKGYEMWGLVSKDLKAPPIEYLKKFWFDSVLWNPKGLQYLIDLVGEERVVPGTDFPFDLCQWPPEIPSDKGIRTLLG